MTRRRPPRLTRQDLDAIHAALEFVLAGEIDEDCLPCGEDALVTAKTKVALRLVALDTRNGTFDPSSSSK